MKVVARCGAASFSGIAPYATGRHFILELPPNVLFVLGLALLLAGLFGYVFAALLGQQTDYNVISRVIYYALEPSHKQKSAGLWFVILVLIDHLHTVKR